MEEKTCVKCKKTLSVASFNRASRSKDGLQSWCRECQSEANRLFTKRQKRRLYARKWYRKAKAKSAPRPGNGHAEAGNGKAKTTFLVVDTKKGQTYKPKNVLAVDGQIVVIL